MTALLAFLLGAFVYGAVLFASGWYLRSLRDRYRAEAERDREWDRTARDAP